MTATVRPQRNHATTSPVHVPAKSDGVPQDPVRVHKAAQPSRRLTRSELEGIRSARRSARRRVRARVSPRLGLRERAKAALIAAGLPRSYWTKRRSRARVLVFHRCANRIPGDLRPLAIRLWA